MFASAVIIAIQPETPGVKTFTITYADGSAIPYASGQFLTLVFHHHGREERRSFSISSSAAANEPLTITVKRVDNGAYSRLLADRAAVGDVLLTTGAAGLFRLPEAAAAYRQVFFFAAGIGITPIFSLIKTMLHTLPATHVVLVYSNRSRGDAVFYDALLALSARFSHNFSIVWLFSNAYNATRARLNKDLAKTLLRQYATAPPDELLCYVCGPYAYMRMAIYALQEYGVPDAHIRKENFNAENREVITSSPPDTNPHQVTLLHNKQQYIFTAQYPDTILKAAKRQNIALPYSCEAGRCGSCVARCTAGKVWLSYNEVLTDTDLHHGSILTCTGYAVGGDVVIEA